MASELLLLSACGDFFVSTFVMLRGQIMDKNEDAPALPVLRMMALGPGGVVAEGGKSNSQ
eukprot:scaffold11020_cov66-Cyclotella_meneghiniana.AAC.2